MAVQTKKDSTVKRKKFFDRFKRFKPSFGFYWALSLGVTILALVAGWFFYYQYLARQIHQLPLYDFQFPQETKTLPPIPITITETPFQRPFLGSSFTDLFSGAGWLDTEKTTLYQDFSMTQLSFPPKFEWKKMPDEEAAELRGRISFIELREDGSDRRCVGDKCLTQREAELFLNDVKIVLPAELQTSDLLNISIGSIPLEPMSLTGQADKFWLVGGVIKEAGQYRGVVYKFDGSDFTKIFNDNDFLSPYPGVFGFGGASDNWLAIYGAYEGIAWQAQTVKGVTYFHNVSRFFPIRVMGDSVKLAEAKERFVSFRPQAIRDGSSPAGEWYVYSLTEGKPKFIKLVEDDEGKISAAWDLTKNLGLDSGVKSAIFTSERPGLLLALILKNTEQELWRFTDFGFDKSKSLEAVSANINNLPGQVVSATISELDLTIFGGSPPAGGLKHVFLLSNDGESWHEVKPKKTFEFPKAALSAAKAGNKVFWKATFAPDQDTATSPVLNRLQLEYQVRL